MYVLILVFLSAYDAFPTIMYDPHNESRGVFIAKQQMQFWLPLYYGMASTQLKWFPLTVSNARRI